MRMLKKSLAICLAAIVALTAMCGCIVSAAVIEGGTVVAGDVEITSDATSVTVPITVTAPASTAEATYNFDLVRVKVTSNIGKLTNVELIDCSKDEDGVTNLVKDVVLADDVNTDVGIIIIEAQSMDFPFTFATVNATFNITDDAFAYGKEYAVDVLGITDIEGADYNENGYSFTYDDGVITVDCAHIAAEAVVENNVEATCNKAGSYDSVVYCSVCNEEMTRETVSVEATGDHTAGEPVVENNVDPTCAVAGSYDSVVYCSVCDAEISRETVEVPATGNHDYVDGTCSVCGAEDPDAVVDVTEYIADIVVTNKAEDQSVNGAVYYDAAASTKIATYVNSLGGEITKLGLVITWDGTDPTVSDTGANGFMPIPVKSSGTDGTALMMNGLNLGMVASSFYANMNIYQVATTEVKQVSYVEYVVDGETVTIYDEVVSQVLMDYLVTQTEDEKAKMLVDTYNLANAAASEYKTYATDVMDADYGPNIVVSYNLANIEVSATYNYTAAQSRAIAKYVQDKGGEITKLGMTVTWDGTDPKSLENGMSAGMDIPAGGTGMMANGLALNGVASGFYQQMNVKQFASDVKYASFVTYTVDGESITEYIGDVKVYKFIDLIQEDTSDLAVAYKDMYSTFVG